MNMMSLVKSEFDRSKNEGDGGGGKGGKGGKGEGEEGEGGGRTYVDPATVLAFLLSGTAMLFQNLILLLFCADSSPSQKKNNKHEDLGHIQKTRRSTKEGRRGRGAKGGVEYHH